MAADNYTLVLLLTLLNNTIIEWRQFQKNFPQHQHHPTCFSLRSCSICSDSARALARAWSSSSCDVSGGLDGLPLVCS